MHFGKTREQSFHDAGWTFGALADRLEKLCPTDPGTDTWTKPDAYLTDIEAVEA
jgi:hypothetical protein